MDFTTRPARVADIPALARAFMDATGGLVEAVYEGAIPGRSAQLIVEHLFSRPGATTSFANATVAERDGKVIGAIHAFPMDAMGDSPPDPLVADDRGRLFEPFVHMHADGSYYLMALAVDAACRGHGVGRRLMAEAEAIARSRGFAQTSLNVFAENHGAVRLYEALGYRERARQPAVAHEKMRFGGDILLMTRDL